MIQFTLTQRLHVGVNWINLSSEDAGGDKVISSWFAKRNSEDRNTAQDDTWVDLTSETESEVNTLSLLHWESGINPERLEMTDL